MSGKTQLFDQMKKMINTKGANKQDVIQRIASLLEDQEAKQVTIVNDRKREIQIDSTDGGGGEKSKKTTGKGKTKF